MQEYIQLARLLLHNNVEMNAIWRAGGTVEYYLRTDQNVMLQVSAQDAHALSIMVTHGAKHLWK